jgi:serine/threonine-protein kinase
MSAVAVLIMLLSRPVWQDHPNANQLLVVRVMQILTLLMSLALFVVVRSGLLRRVTVLKVGLVYEVIFCLTVSVGYNWFTGSTYGVFASMTMASVVIAIYPMIIPSRPRHTLVAALAAAATAPLGILVVDLLGVAQASWPDYLGVSIYPFVCAGFAVFGSAIVHRLNTDVAAAAELGSYQLEEMLGQGGMGEVWRARHRLLARPAAIKLIRPRGAPQLTREREDQLLRRFEREAQATASLQSPHTVDLYDFGRGDNGTFYYVMELLDGIDLERLVDRFGPLPAERVACILTQVCRSLGEAHHHGLVHRDIKPANILLCRFARATDFVKVLDFGLVALEPERGHQDLRLTADGVFGGTPAYVAPEMVAGQPVDARADIYQLGCVAFRLLTGRLVFEADTALQLIMAHMSETPMAPSLLAENPVPKELDQILLSCLSKSPDDRPGSADALAEALERSGLCDGWTRERAQQWWQQHRPTRDSA